MDEWLFMEGHRCRGPWFMTHFTLPPEQFQSRMARCPKKATKDAHFLLRGDPLTKTSAFDFTYDHYDERKGVIAACDYCSYNC